MHTEENDSREITIGCDNQQSYTSYIPLEEVISDRSDVKFPVFRSGQEPDYLATGGTGKTGMP